MSDIPEDILRDAFRRLRGTEFLALQLVCRSWRRAAWSISQELCDTRDIKALLLISPSEIRAIRPGNLSLRRPSLLEFPKIQLPVKYLVGTCDGLICVVDSNLKIFIFNPLSLEIGEIPEKGHTPYSYKTYSIALGWKIVDEIRCYILVKVQDINCRMIRIFNIKSREWKIHTFSLSWTCKLESQDAAFSQGTFLWLGLVQNEAGTTPSVIKFDATTENFDHIDLPVDMRAFTLGIGNLGDKSVMIWSSGNETNCFWRFDLNTSSFSPVEISAYPTGINFRPICDLSTSKVLLLRSDSSIDLYNHIDSSYNSCYKTTERLRVASFSATQISPWQDRLVFANLCLENSAAVEQGHQIDQSARTKYKGKGKGCVNCGALNHLFEECIDNCTKKQKLDRCALLYHEDTVETQRGRHKSNHLKVQDESKKKRSGSLRITENPHKNYGFKEYRDRGICPEGGSNIHCSIIDAESRMKGGVRLQCVDHEENMGRDSRASRYRVHQPRKVEVVEYSEELKQRTPKKISLRDFGKKQRDDDGGNANRSCDVFYRRHSSGDSRVESRVHGRERHNNIASDGHSCHRSEFSDRNNDTETDSECRDEVSSTDDEKDGREF